MGIPTHAKSPSIDGPPNFQLHASLMIIVATIVRMLVIVRAIVIVIVIIMVIVVVS